MQTLIGIRAMSLRAQFVICLAAVGLSASACFLAKQVVGYRVTALVLLMVVSLMAMLFRMGPVMTAAALSAVVWNFFFIPPTFTLHIGIAEDLLLFLLYFVIATVNAVLTFKIRQAERRARDREEKAKSIVLYNTLLNSLSHELRTPIAAIVGAVDTMKENDAALTPAQREDLLASMDDAAARLDRQVGNLLHMGRLQGGVLVPKADWCDVNEVVGRVVNALVEGTHQIAFTPDPDLPLFKLDGGLIEQVVHNLAYNAVIHTPPGTVVTITVRDERQACMIRVSDDGPGLGPEDRARAFEKFHRAAGTRTGGTGLGLSIVKGFTEAMGGIVGVEPVAPRGVCFLVQIPAATSHLSQLKNE